MVCCWLLCCGLVGSFAWMGWFDWCLGCLFCGLGGVVIFGCLCVMVWFGVMGVSLMFGWLCVFCVVCN